MTYNMSSSNHRRTSSSNRHSYTNHGNPSRSNLPEALQALQNSNHGIINPNLILNHNNALVSAASASESNSNPVHHKRSFGSGTNSNSHVSSGTGSTVGPNHGKNLKESHTTTSNRQQNLVAAGKESSHSHGHSHGHRSSNARRLTISQAEFEQAQRANTNSSISNEASSGSKRQSHSQVNSKVNPVNSNSDRPGNSSHSSHHNSNSSATTGNSVTTSGCLNLNSMSNKNMMRYLIDSGVLQMGNQKVRRGSFAVGSFTQSGDEDQDSYDDKNVVTEGGGSSSNHSATAVNHELLKSHGVGIRCKKGYKPDYNLPNQDSFTFIHYEKEFDLYGVFDGHGLNGHDVSNMVRDFLPKLFISDSNRINGNIKKAFEDSFRKMQAILEASTSVDCLTSGTTCTLVYRTHADRNLLHIAYCGDSRAALVALNTNNLNKQQTSSTNTNSHNYVVKGFALSKDHKPNIPSEKARIERSGGCVIYDGFYNHRVYVSNNNNRRGSGSIGSNFGHGSGLNANCPYPGLNMSRALGDVLGNKEAGIVETPDYQCVNLDNINGNGSTSSNKYDTIMFLLCSDGVWEFLNEDQVAKIVTSNKCCNSNLKIDPHLAAEMVAKESWKKWMDDTGGEMCDDITVVMQVL